MKALVTGGGGFLGGAVVRALRGRGDAVRSFSRGAYPDLDRLGVEQLSGDLGDASAVHDAAAGQDVVFHVAGKVGAWGPYEEYRRVNVDGTDHVVAACRSHGIRALVFTSSPSVVFDGSDFEGGDEAAPYPTQFHPPYPRSKAEAEQRVLEADSPGALRTLALRPHLILGEGDQSLTPRILSRHAAGRLRRISGPPKKVDITWVEDAVRAHLLAADDLLAAARGGGKPYFISSGDPLPIAEVIDRILAAAGRPALRRQVHPRVAWLAASVMEAAWHLLGREDEPPLTRWVVQEMASAHWFDLSAAQRDLGYRPEVTHAEGFAAMSRWLSGEGKVLT